MTCTRGTSNGNAAGSSYDRRRRKVVLIERYRADDDLWDVDLQAYVPAARCYRCGQLLSAATVTADRIVPGCKGGTYRQENLRPACGPCNSIVGGGLRSDK